MGWLTSDGEEGLKLMESITSKSPKDRLDLLNLMNLSLYIMANNLLIWYERLEDPEAFSLLKLEELEEIAFKISKMVENFVKYDIKTTKKFSKKALKPRV